MHIAFLVVVCFTFFFYFFGYKFSGTFSCDYFCSFLAKVHVISSLLRFQKVNSTNKILSFFLHLSVEDMLINYIFFLQFFNYFFFALCFLCFLANFLVISCIFINQFSVNQFSEFNIS